MTGANELALTLIPVIVTAVPYLGVVHKEQEKARRLVIEEMGRSDYQKDREDANKLTEFPYNGFLRCFVATIIFTYGMYATLEMGYFRTAFTAICHICLIGFYSTSNTYVRVKKYKNRIEEDTYNRVLKCTGYMRLGMWAMFLGAVSIVVLNMMFAFSGYSIKVETLISFAIVVGIDVVTFYDVIKDKERNL